MQQFSISDIERMTGIKGHTLRMWEQRYAIFPAGRPPNSHRNYSASDLQYLLQLSHLYKNGYRISTIAGFSEQERKEHINATLMLPGAHRHLIETLIKASQQMDDDLFASVLKFINLQLGVKDSILNIIYPFLDHLGLLWMNNAIVPAQEHFASNHLRNFVTLAIDELPPVATNKHEGVVLLMAPEHEYHYLPLLFIQYLMKMNGVPAIMLGPNVRRSVVKSYVSKQVVRIIHYHHITNFTEYNSQQYFDLMCRQFDNTMIVASGALIAGLNNEHPNGYLIRDLHHLIKYCEAPFEVLKD